MRFGEVRVGECGWVQKVVGWRVFPSPGGCLRANVNDGTYVRRCSEVPVIVRFG